MGRDGRGQGRWRRYKSGRKTRGPQEKDTERQFTNEETLPNNTHIKECLESFYREYTQMPVPTSQMTSWLLYFPEEFFHTWEAV